ncbi:MAG TPA: DsrE family protein [Planctomycetia bacterium]|nr:DsrE family protein [Planctomycetia bacterium]
MKLGGWAFPALAAAFLVAVAAFADPQGKGRGGGGLPRGIDPLRSAGNLIGRGIDEFRPVLPQPVQQQPLPFPPAQQQPPLQSPPANVVFQPAPQEGWRNPIIPVYGAVADVPGGAEPPRPGARVVLDVSRGANPVSVNPGLDRAARLVNLYGASGLRAVDLQLAVVLHGEAATAALSESSHRARVGASNPNLPLLVVLRRAGVEVAVCGQTLARKGIRREELSGGLVVATSAMLYSINRQSQGFVALLDAD